VHPPAPTLTYTLSLHDALPICPRLESVGGQGLVLARNLDHHRHDRRECVALQGTAQVEHRPRFAAGVQYQTRREGPVQQGADLRSEEHTSELQSRENLVCRLLL